MSSGGDVGECVSWKDEFRLRSCTSDNCSQGPRARVSSSGFGYDESQRGNTRPRLTSWAGSITHTGSLMASVRPLEMYERRYEEMQQAQFEFVHDMVRANRKQGSSTESSSRLLPVHSRSSVFGGFPLHPTSLARIVFDAMCVVFLVLDLVFVPVIIAWNIAMTDFWLYLGWTIAIFWTCDMILNFCTGYTDGSTL
eukprot:5146115-Amphidinium_carterae.1